MEQEKCICEHSREMHDNRFSKLESNQGPQRGRGSNGKCKADNCACDEYIEK